MTLISHIDLALNDYDEIQVVQYMTLVKKKSHFSLAEKCDVNSLTSFLF